LQALQSPGRRVIARRERPHPGAQLLERWVDFDRLTQSDTDSPAPERPLLVLGAVDVMSGVFKAFDSRRGEITADAVLASAAIPTLFRSVPVDGGLYWDGLFYCPSIRSCISSSRSTSFSKRQMAYVDERQGCGIVFQRGDPTSFLPVAQCHATFGRARPPGRVRSDRHGRLGHAQRVRTGSLPLEPLVKRSQHAVHLVLNVTGSQ
jgi:hypothetical protein